MVNRHLAGCGLHGNRSVSIHVLFPRQSDINIDVWFVISLYYTLSSGGEMEDYINMSWLVEELFFFYFVAVTNT